jgi:hypothetical protein
MTEREGQPWDIGAFAKTLGVKPQPVDDIAVGLGSRLSVATTTIEVFPDAGVTRLFSRSARVELFRLDPPTADEHGIIFQSSHSGEDARVLVTPDGTVNLTIGPARAPAAEPAGSIATEVRETRGEDPQDTASAAAEKAPRVVFTGRIGRDPQVRSTRNGRTIARMPLAVHEGETTSWHTILFFDDAAQRAVETLSKGKLVTIIGYKHVRDVQKRDGSTAQVEEIYAAAVQPPK